MLSPSCPVRSSPDADALTGLLSQTPDRSPRTGTRRLRACPGTAPVQDDTSTTRRQQGPTVSRARLSPSRTQSSFPRNILLPLTIKSRIVVAPCDPFRRNHPVDGGWRGAPVGTQLTTRRRVQSPALSVKEEMRRPHGSDWASIREAGRNAGMRGTRPCSPASRVCG